MKNPSRPKKPSNETSQEPSRQFAWLEDLVSNRTKVEALGTIIQSLAQLADNGDKESFELLVGLARQASMSIFQIVQTNFEMARHVARGSLYWPSLLSSSKQINSYNASLVKRLELATESSYPLNIEELFQRRTDPRDVVSSLLIITENLRLAGQALSVRRKLKANLELAKDNSSAELTAATPAFEAALESTNNIGRSKSKFSIVLLQAFAVKLGVDPVKLDSFPIIQYMQEAYVLPKLSPKTVKEWAAFGWRIIMVLTDAAPQSHPFLRKMGSYKGDAYLKKLVRQTHGKVIPAEVDKLRASGRARDSVESNIRDGISDSIEGAYRSIANQRGV